MAQSKMSCGDYQMFENITSIPKEFLNGISQFKDMNIDCMHTLKDLRATLKSYDSLANKGIESVDELKEMFKASFLVSNKDPFSMGSIMENITKHPAGLIASLTAMMRSKDSVDFISSLVTMTSLLGFEQNVISNIRNRWEQMEITSRLNQYHSGGNVIKTLCLLLALLGKTAVGSSISDFSLHLRDAKKNATLYKDLLEEVEDLAEEHGFGFSTRAKVVKEIKDELESIIRDMYEFEHINAVSPVRFCRQTTYKKFKACGLKIERFMIELSKRSLKDFIGTSMSAEIMSLQNRYNKLKASVEIVRRTNGERVKPVGIIIYGTQSQIGKSKLMSEIEHRVKQRFVDLVKANPTDPLIQEFVGADHWETWNQSFRDKYDQNFMGQDLHSIDDCFTSKDNREHQMLITYISNRCIPSYQASLEMKGFSYECKYVMASCNTFPRESVEINNIHALAERFNIFVHASLVEGKVPPADGVLDRSFDWLNLHQSTGHNYYTRPNNADCHVCYGSNNNVTIDAIVDSIVTQMMIYQRSFLESQSTYSQYEVTNEGFKDAKDFEIFKGNASRNPEIREGCRNRYRSMLDLPTRVSRGILTSKTQDPLALQLLLINGIQREQFYYMQDAAGCKEIEDILAYFVGFKFIPQDNYAQDVENFINNSTFYCGFDDRYIFHKGYLYFNNLWNNDDDNEDFPPPEETYEEYQSRTMYFYSLFTKIFCDTTFVVYGIMFIAMSLLGLPVTCAFMILINIMKVHSIFTATQEDTVHDVFGGLMIKALGIFVIWLLYKFVFFLAKQIKNYLLDPVWDHFSKEKEIIISTYESNKVVFLKRNIYKQMNDYTVVLLTPNAKKQGSLHLLKVAPRQQLGSVCDYLHKGVYVRFMYCLNDDYTVNERAFCRCLDVASSNKSFFDERDISEKLKILLEQHGDFEKVICYHNDRYEYTHPYSNHPIRKHKQVQSYEESSDSDEYEGGGQEGSGAPTNKRQQRQFRAYENEGSGKPVNKRSSKNFRSYDEKYENEGSGKPTNKRSPRNFRSYENEGSGKPMNQRKQRTLRSYETFEAPNHIDYESKKQKKTFIDDIDVSTDLESSFGEEDYNPSCLEDENAIRLEDIGEMESDSIVMFPKEDSYSFEQAERKLDGKYEGAVDASANAILCKIKREFMVFVSNSNSCVRSSLYGFGIGRYIIFPSHLVFSEGEIVTFQSCYDTIRDPCVYYAKVVKFKKEWELCSAEILPIKHPLYKDKLLKDQNNKTFKHDMLRYVPLDHDVGAKSLTKYCLQHLPKQGFIIPGMVSYIQKYKATLSGQPVEAEIYAMRTLPHMNAQSIPGDCGGCVVMLDTKCTRKLVGMHIGSASNVRTYNGTTESHGIIAILSYSRINVLTNGEYSKNDGEYQSLDEYPKITWAKSNKYDNFEELFSAGEGRHMPHSDYDAFDYLGDLEKLQPSCDIHGSTDHHQAPFYKCFEETKRPSCLLDCDVVDTSKLRCDTRGVPSIIVTQLSGYGDKEHLMDIKILNNMISQFKEYSIDVLTGYPVCTSLNPKTAMWEAINGQYFNDDFDKLNEKSSAVIPWSNLGIQHKADILEDRRILNPFRTSKEDKFINGKYLKRHCSKTNYFKRVFNNKLEQAKHLKRTCSIWKACKKDELRTIEKVNNGSTRVFIAPPLESFFMGRYLFGRWKAAFKANSNKFFHAIGVDMKSCDVIELISYFKQHPNYLDVDYKAFDQRILAQVIKAVAVIVVESIRHFEKNDGLANARYVYFEEVMKTIICAERTVFMTKHGNKSGNVLTTELNCLVNVLYCWYVFIKTTGMQSLHDFMHHVKEKNYGDDKGVSFSNEVKDKFNFVSYQRIMAELGQVVTPGNKSDSVTPYFTNLTEMCFLKRQFKEYRPNLWLAPLDKTSIESVFNYSCLTEEDVEEWKTLIVEQIIEAALHGALYYKVFITKLREYVSTAHFKQYYPILREFIFPILLFRYTDVMTQYFVRIGILAPSEEQNEIVVTTENYNGRTKLTYENKLSLRKRRLLKTIKENQYESNQEVECISTLENNYKDNNNKNIINARNTECISVMANIKNFIQQRLSCSSLGLNYGMTSHEINPETHMTLESIQSDVGKPVQVKCSDGLVYAYDLSQGHVMDNLPVMDKQLSLPDEIKHFMVDELVNLDGITPRYINRPILKNIAPKAYQLHDIFQFNRVHRTIVRIDSRPPLGYAQKIKVSATTSETDDDSAFNRKGVVYDLSKCPTMYFIVPYSDRQFVKTIEEPWFKLLIEQITKPVARTDIPSPFRFRISYEVNQMDYFVHIPRTVPVVPIEPTTSYTYVQTDVFTYTGEHLSCPLFTPSELDPGDTFRCAFALCARDNATGLHLAYIPANTLLEYVADSTVKDPLSTLLDLRFGQTSALGYIQMEGTVAKQANLLTYTNVIPSLRRDIADKIKVLKTGKVSLSNFMNHVNDKNVGDYQSDEEILATLEPIKNKHDYVSQLKHRADKEQLEIKYSFEVKNHDRTNPIFECTCVFKDMQVNSYGVGKKAAKQYAAEAMLLQIDGNVGVYESDMDVASSEPQLPQGPKPPVASASSNASAMAQTVGVLSNHVEVTDEDFVPIKTYAVNSDLPDNKTVFILKIHPGNFTSNGSESQAQILFRNHTMSGPKEKFGKKTYCDFKVTTSANAFQNARLIIAQIPIGFSDAQIKAFTPYELKQFINTEHKIQGTETMFNPQWVNRLPTIINHLVDDTNINGTLVCKILEDSLTTGSTDAQLTLFVRATADSVNYTIPRTPAALPSA